MGEMIDKLAYYFSFPFVRYAMIVGLLIALCSSLLGVTLVLKRFSFIGDGLSHVAFGAMATATVISVSLKGAVSGNNAFAKWLTDLIENTNSMVIILPVTLIAAILLLKTGQNTKIKGDAAIAMISVASLAIGYMLINMFSASANIAGDVCSTLFGSTSILTLTVSEVWLSVALAVIVIVIFLLFYNKIFAVTFDESFAKATGIRANAYNLLIAVVTALIIVLAMNLVGSLLISALIIFPALSAMRVFKSFKAVIICSAVISVICAGFGLIASILFSTPVGSTIVTADMIVFFLFCIISKCLRRS
ncbi:MAG: metal ABC transporter permease [Ruminococcus sp.]|nr:metal ABC transporter permease [Ruminococcus sp.]